VKTYEEFILRAREAHITPDLWRQLRHIYVENGPLLQLVFLIICARGDMQEALTKMHMISDEAIRRAIGQQGQIAGVDQILAQIYEAMKEPTDDNTEQVSADERASAP
jgi:hypothetical protein